MHASKWISTIALLLAGALLDAEPAAKEDRAQWRADTRAAIPRIAKQPVCDGIIAEDEWATAWRYDGVLNPVSMNLFPRSVQWCVAWDKKHVYIASRTPVLKGETVKDELGEDIPSLRDLRRNDSVEVWLSPTDSKVVLHYVVNPQGRTYSRVTGLKHNAQPEALPAAAAKVHDGALQYEIRIPVEALGRSRGNRHGDAWRILLVRDFQGAAALQAALPNGFERTLSNVARHPLFTLTQRSPTVRFANPRRALYAGRTGAAIEVANPTPKAAKIVVNFRVTDLSGERFARHATLDVPAGETLAMKIDEPTAPPIDPKAEAEHRYELTVNSAHGETLFHTHFLYDPTDSPEWLSDALPQSGRAGERVLLVDPNKEGIPFKFQRHCNPYENLPAGDKIRLLVRRMWEPSKRHHYDSVQATAAVDPQGQKHGEERFYDPYGHSLKRIISWQHGARHGPEQTMAVGDHNGRRKRYARTITPWANGVVHGVKRTYHPSGQVMNEVQYVQGQPTGKATSYDGEGRVVRITEYQSGMRQGLMTDYWPRQPKRIVPYERSQINGVVREFHPNGQRKRDRPFRHDVLHGIEKQYDDTGELVKTRYWRDGDPVTEAEYDAKPGE